MTPELIHAPNAEIGEGMVVRRALPTQYRRMVGAWCFLDHFGPFDMTGRPGMRIGPHPHIGLQTVTWLLRGELLHRDSLGTTQAIRPGALNLMTAGRGVSHSEDSTGSEIHGVQFWIALPEAARAMAPAFEHHPKLPLARIDRLRISVLVGELFGDRSPATVHSPLVGASIEAAAASVATIPVKPEWEYAAIVTHGRAEIAGQRVIPGAMVYLAPGRKGIPIITGAGDAGIILVGGLPFPEQILMWWNFVGRAKDELTQACRDWNAGAEYLGDVRGALGNRLVAPLPPWADRPTLNIQIPR